MPKYNTNWKNRSIEELEELAHATNAVCPTCDAGYGEGCLFRNGKWKISRWEPTMFHRSRREITHQIMVTPAQVMHSLNVKYGNYSKKGKK